MPRYNNTDETIKAIRDRFNVYFEIPCDSDDHRVQEIIGIVIRTIKEQPTADVVPKSEVALEAIDDFQNTLRSIFFAMCDQNYYNNLNLLQIDSAIEALLDSKIAELKNKYTEEKE